MTDWTNDRLDQLAFAVEANTATIATNAAAIAELRAAVVETRGSVNSLLEIAMLHQQNFETSQRNFEAIQAEIRGLQTENRRIFDAVNAAPGGSLQENVDRLFGQDGG